jgi:hypothetical protein
MLTQIQVTRASYFNRQVVLQINKQANKQTNKQTNTFLPLAAGRLTGQGLGNGTAICRVLTATFIFLHCWEVNR